MLKNGKLFGLINILDLLVLICIVGAVIIIAPNFLLNSKSNTQGASGEAKTVYFTIEFAQAGQDLADMVSVGDMIRDNVKGYYYGKVENVYTKPSTKVIPNLDKGIFEEAPMPGDVDVFITIKANGSESDRDILAEGQPIKIGKQMNVKGKGYCSVGHVIDLYTE